MKKKSKVKGNDFEKKVVKTIRSGALWFAPSDINYQDYIIECKFTEKKSFRITLNMIEKLWNQSLSLNKEPLLVIGIKRNERETFIINCRINIEGR